MSSQSFSRDSRRQSHRDSFTFHRATHCPVSSSNKTSVWLCVHRLVTDAAVGVVPQADFAAGDAESGVIEGGHPLVRNCSLRYSERDETAADGSIQTIFDGIFRVGYGADLHPQITRIINGSA